MPQKFIIEVTKDDIAKGVQESCQQCPIALAVMRILGVSNVSVGSNCMRIHFSETGKQSALVQLPAIAVDFITDFDMHGNGWIDPIKFEIELP